MTAVFNSLLSYLLLVLVIVVLAGIAIFAGITLRKSKNRKEEMAAAALGAGTEESVEENNEA